MDSIVWKRRCLKRLILINEHLYQYAHATKLVSASSSLEIFLQPHASFQKSWYVAIYDASPPCQRACFHTDKSETMLQQIKDSTIAGLISSKHCVRPRPSRCYIDVQTIGDLLLHVV